MTCIRIMNFDNGQLYYKVTNVACLRCYTWCHFWSSLAEYFTIAVYSYSGESELRELVCGTIYASKTDREK